MSCRGSLLPTEVCDCMPGDVGGVLLGGACLLGSLVRVSCSGAVRMFSLVFGCG